MRPAAPGGADLPLLAACVFLAWTAGVPVRARAATPHRSDAAIAREYRVSGNRSERSLQGLLGFLQGFRLGHGLATGLHAHFSHYDLYNHHPVRPIFVLAGTNAQPAIQQQIVNLLGANDVGENYQELNGHNVQVIKGFSEPVRMDINDSSINKAIDKIKIIVNETNETINDDPNELVEIKKSRVKVREALTTETPKDCKNSENCMLIDSSDNHTTVLPEVPVDATKTETPIEVTTSENQDTDIPTSTVAVPSSQYNSSKPEFIYPNRTYPYPYGMLNGTSIEEISFTTDVTTSYFTETKMPAPYQTYLQRLALPLEENGWEHFAKTKLGDSGFRPINGNYYYI